MLLPIKFNILNFVNHYLAFIYTYTPCLNTMFFIFVFNFIKKKCQAICLLCFVLFTLHCITI